MLTAALRFSVVMFPSSLSVVRARQAGATITPVHHAVIRGETSLATSGLTAGVTQSLPCNSIRFPKTPIPPGYLNKTPYLRCFHTSATNATSASLKRIGSPVRRAATSDLGDEPWSTEGYMRHTLAVSVALVFATPFPNAGAGSNQPTNIAPCPSGAHPAKLAAGNFTDSSASITWYTCEQAVTTLVKVGIYWNNINLQTDCGPRVYTGIDNLWLNTRNLSGLNPDTRHYFGVGGTDTASNLAFSSVDSTNNPTVSTLNVKPLRSARGRSVRTII